MRSPILSVLTFFVCISAQASNFADPNLAAVNDLQPQQIPRIDIELARPVATQLGTKKLTFAIQWEKTKCSAAEGSEGGTQGGVCIFTAIVNGNLTAKVGAVISHSALVGAHVISVDAP